MLCSLNSDQLVLMIFAVGLLFGIAAPFFPLIEKRKVQIRQKRNWQKRDEYLNRLNVNEAENYSFEAKINKKKKIIFHEVIVDNSSDKFIFIDYSARNIKIISIRKSSVLGFRAKSLNIMLADSKHPLYHFDVSKIIGFYKGYTEEYVADMLSSIFIKNGINVSNE